MWSILLLIFIPKILYEKNRKAAIVNSIVVPNIKAAIQAAIANVFEDDNDDVADNDNGDRNSIGDRILSTENSQSLIKSNKTLRRYYQAKEVELEAKEEQLHALNIANEDMKKRIETLTPAQVELQAKKAELCALIITNENLRIQIETLTPAQTELQAKETELHALIIVNDDLRGKIETLTPAP